jgi:predicted transposase/invertase (TIGR01784 family)
VPIACFGLRSRTCRRTKLVELIETVIMAKLTRLSREEIQTMLQLHDIRESRVYQEAKEEGVQEGAERERQRNFQRDLRAITLMAAKHMRAAEIAEILGLEVEFVCQQIAKSRAE